MQINPVLTPLQLGDRLHLFASSAAAAASALDCLQSDAAFDCALNARLGAPLTTRALPTALALLTIIPEREEDPRNSRGARGSEEMPRSRSLGALRSVEEADEKWGFRGGRHARHAEGLREAEIPAERHFGETGETGETEETDSMGASIPAGEESEVSESAGMIELERLPTAASVNITSSDIQINRGMVLDSAHFYESSDEDFASPAERHAESPRDAPSPVLPGVSMEGEGVLTGGSEGVLTGGLETPPHVRTTGSLAFQ